MQKVPVRKFQTYKHGAVLPEEVNEQGIQKMGDEGAFVELREVAASKDA
jgi:hypothetical protein